MRYLLINGPLARYVKLRVAHAPGRPETFSLPPRVSDLDMQHDTCVTHVPWCMPGSLPSGFVGGENVPGIPGACATRNSTCLVRGPWPAASVITSFRYFYQFHSCHYFWMTTCEQILFMTMWKETSFALNRLFIRRNETYTWPLFNSFGPRKKERNFTGLFKIDLFHEISCLYFD